MARVIRLYYVLIFAWNCLLHNHRMITARSINPAFHLKGTIWESLEKQMQNAEDSLGKQQTGDSLQVPRSAVNTTVAISLFNGTLIYNPDYPSDHVIDEGAQEHLEKLGLSVQCGDNGMSLKVPGTRVSHLLVDRAGALPVPVSQLPSHCGFSVRRARRDVTLEASYNGCHVIQQGGNYILPLHVYGIPVTMSCPVGSTSPPTVSCGPSSMVVKLEGAVAEHLLMKVEGSWVPLLEVCEQCGYNVDYDNGHLLITIPFTTTCVEPEDSGPTVRLLSPAGEMTLVCPSAITTAATPLPYLPFYPFQWPKAPLIAPVTTTAAPTALPLLYPLFNPYYQMPFLKPTIAAPHHHRFYQQWLPGLESFPKPFPKPVTAPQHHHHRFYQQWLPGLESFPKPFPKPVTAPQYHQRWLPGLGFFPKPIPKPLAADPQIEFYPNQLPKWPHVTGKWTSSNSLYRY